MEKEFFASQYGTYEISISDDGECRIIENDTGDLVYRGKGHMNCALMLASMWSHCEHERGKNKALLEQIRIRDN